ncbi:ATP-binding protein [Kordia periserrulae]|uniref:ATP-binding protein n=1 Tax=Kordia periserrulae TaxID=701523 RepID=UPI001FECA34F|nr:tetratricopeptide repeat-containing sensor histidine kinase [Kordia periserrulae]
MYDKLINSIEEKTATLKKDADFQKVVTFLAASEWDSTLVYSSKILNTDTNNQKLNDYIFFFRGFSFFNKKLYNDAENALLKISNTFDFLPNTLSKLGSIALEKSDFKKALSYYLKVEELAKTQNVLVRMDRVKHNIGLCYLHLQKFPNAEKYLKESRTLHEKGKDTIQLIGCYGDLATLYYDQYKDDQAIPLFQKAYDLAKTTNDFDAKAKTTKNMAVVEENRKDYLKALQYRKEYEQWKDSVNDQNKIYAVAQEEKKTAVEKKEKEVAILKADNKVKDAQGKMYLYSAIILFVMFGVSFYFYREKVKRNKIIHQQKEDLDELNATKDKLFSIVSHDLRSSVHAIKTSNKKLISKLETEKSTEVNSLLQNNSSIVNSAYTLLDNLLNWALLQTKQTHFEITTLRLHTIVEHVAYNYKAILADKEISFKNTVAKSEFVLADSESLKIVLRNLLDNAIKFSNEGDAITIYTKNNDTEFCQLIVEDTGIGMSETTRLALLEDTSLLAKKQHENSIGTGLGMQLCKSMIKKNNGTFTIESELGKGTKIILSLPKKPT